jgi:hypothetical protein
MNRILLPCLLLLCILTTTCRKKKNEIPMLEPGSLTALPLDEVDFHVLTPLGNINPPGHVFPSDHGGFYVKHFGTPSNVKSPGKLRIFEISRDRHGVGLPTQTQDFSIVFGHPDRYRLWLGHVSNITSKLMQAANNFSDAQCNQYIAGGVTHEQCRKSVELDVEAGEIIGTAGTQPGQYGVDFGLFINGKFECVLGYFAPAQRAILEARMGSYDPIWNITVLRTKPPLCGELYQNINGTLHGEWLKTGSPRYPEDPHIGFFKDMVDPDIPRISVGSGLGNFAGGYLTFTPQASGFINRKFSEVTPGNTYCYKPTGYNASLLVRMNDNSSLQVEYRPSCDCSCNTSYSFGANMKTFRRE